MSDCDFITDRKDHHLEFFPVNTDGNKETTVISHRLEEELRKFESLWRSDDPFLYAATSGSTGTAKNIRLPKEGMINSAVMTCSFLKLPKASTALLCMPLKFIGAKMVVVRAMVASLKLAVVNPSSHPLEHLNFSPFFAAMTPAQVMNCFDNEHDYGILKGIRKLIIGGGPVTGALNEKISSLENDVYSTYGMTETLSHIALKQLCPVCQDNYHLFEGVDLSLSDRNTLIINAPGLGVYNLVTNDIAVIHEDRSFSILGRSDNTINSGGIKIQIEVAESILAKTFKFDFAITAVPDNILGQKVVMLCTNRNTQKIKTECKELLPKYWSPKNVIYAEAIPKTATGKIARSEVKKLALTAVDTYGNIN